MRIAIITSGILPVPAVLGGAVENLIDYALEYNEAHHLHDITVYSIYHEKVNKHKVLKSKFNHYVYVNRNKVLTRIGAKLYSYFGKHYCYHYQLEFYFESVWCKLKRTQYDLIILENRPGFALQLSERCNTPIISHIHTNLLYEPSVKNQKIAKATTRFLAVSQYIKNEILKVGIKKDIRIVYNGLDSSLFNKQQSGAINRSQLGFKDNDFIAVFWGRLVPKKGIKELLLAMQQLKQHQDIKLLVIGAINYEDTSTQTNSFIEELKAIAKELQDKIVFTGFIPYDKIANYLSIGNVAVIPSRINEAFGMTCIEACAMGLPVIATNDGGIPETLVEQKHILLNKEGDLTTQIANAILDIRANYQAYQGNHLNPIFTKEAYAKSFFNNITDIL